MNRLFALAITVFTLFIYTSSEARNFRFGVFGAYGLSNINQTAGSGAAQVNVGDSDQSKNFGAGATIEFGLIGPIGLELGAFYRPRGYVDQATEDEIKYNTSQLTAMFRFDFGESTGKMKLPVSLGLGAYYNQSLDDQVTHVDGTTKASSELDFSDSNLPLGAMGKIDRGLVASIAADYAISKNFLFSFDFRYTYGLTQMLNAESSTGVSGHWQEVSTLMGLMLQF